MRTLLWIAALLVIGAVAGYGVPLAAESAGTTCSALEKRFLTLATETRATGAERDAASLGRALLGSLQGFTNGNLAAEYARREHPNLPAGFGCVVMYWRTFLPGAKVPGLPGLRPA